MASDRIDRIEGLRTTQFPTERRGGYDRAAVDSYLADLADWLGTHEAKAAIAQRELERVGERTGAILSAAQESADRIVAEATAEAEAMRADAERETGEQRSAADSYANEARSKADEDARKLREAAEADAAKTRAEADEHARLTIREADDRLERAARDAEERTAGIENEIAGLAAKRDEIVENLERLSSELRSVIDGPGRADLKLPERSRTAAAFAEEAADEPIAHPEVADAAPLPGEETVEEEPPTAVVPVARFDTDEELYEDEQPPDPVPSGRDPERRQRPMRDPDDPTTDDQKLTELL
jgi:DivIVA domain-containing protein